MPQRLSRRHVLTTLPWVAAAPAVLWRQTGEAQQEGGDDAKASTPLLHHGFPSQDPDRVRSMVAAAHGNLEQVTELVTESPDLAKSAWDWGYGDWESALGAASHTGQREIAELLMAHGARPDLFTFAMLGYLDVVKAYVAAQPGIQRIPGPHGLTLLHHARTGGEAAAAVVAFLEELGDADIEQKSEPLSVEEMARYTGTYRFGPSEKDTLVVEVGRGDMLGVKIPEDFPRTLFYLGEHTFKPSGTSGTRVRFEVVDGKAVSVTILDGVPVVTGKR